jgi:hypothetical protein
MPTPQEIRYYRTKATGLIGKKYTNYKWAGYDAFEPQDYSLDAKVRVERGIVPRPPTSLPYVGIISPYVDPQPATSYDNSFVGQVCQYMKDRSYALDKGAGQINIIYVEGCNADGTLNADAPNEFNDRRLLITFEGSTPKIVGNWEATTEPGFYYTDYPMNPQGAARIKFGQYKGCWQVGIHGNSVPHEALVQVRPVTVFRDYNRDMARTGDKEDAGNFGINQHGGYDYLYSNISQASAGCLVGRTMQGHEEFMTIVKSDPRYRSNQDFEFTTAIIPGDKLSKKV